MYSDLLKDIHEKGLEFDAMLEKARDLNSTLVIKSEKLVEVLKCLPVHKKVFVCSICLTNDANTCIVKCGHVYCEGCLERAKRRSNRCPACRGNIDSTIKIYV